MSIAALVTFAVLIAATVMGVLSARAVMARASCEVHPALLNVAVTDDLAPAVERVARLFNRQQHQADGRCAQVQVTESQPVQVAAQIGDQQPAAGLPAVGAWIPDSSLWVDVARSYPAAARVIRPTGLAVARSPLLIVMPGAAAARVPQFGASVGWRFLLPASAGGPPADLGLRVELPDPGQSATGLASLVEISRLLGPSTTGRAAFAKFALSSQTADSFDDQASLASLASLVPLAAGPSAAARPVTVASEQAVVQYDAAHPDAPLAARYPTAPDRLLGSPELDYPYVVTSSDPVTQQVARQFGQALHSNYAQSVIRYYGFRTPDGAGDAMPASSGLSGQLLSVAVPAPAGEVQTILQTWDRLGLGFNDLVLVDTSAAMNEPSGVPGLTLEQELVKTAGLGLTLFPDSARMGLWEFSQNLSGGLPYRQLVSVGPLPAELGLISRRQQMEQINQTLQASPTAHAALYESILAAYTQMKNSYRPGDANTLVVLTSGVDNASGDISLPALLRRVRELYNPNRRIQIVVVMFGRTGNYAAMHQIAAATGGTASQITRPSQVARVFFAAIADRTCDPSCGQ